MWWKILILAAAVLLACVCGCLIVLYAVTAPDEEDGTGGI